MNERISAFVDGELPEEDCGHAIGNLRHDEKLRLTWDTYHLIGDVLRGDCHRSYSHAVVVELSSEPAMIVAPRPEPRVGKKPLAFALQAAAGVAAIGLVAWLALPMLSPAPEIARSAPAPILASENASPAQIPKNMEAYLQAHQRFSPSGAIQGLAPDVRPVSAEGGEVAR